MAIQRTGAGNTNVDAAAVAAQQAQATAAAAATQQTQTQSQIHLGAQGAGTPKAASYLQQLQGFHLGRTEAGEALVNAERSISEYLEEKGMKTNKNKDGLEYRVITVDSNETSSFASAVVIVGVSGDSTDTSSYAFCHTVVLEGSIQGQLPQSEVQFGNTNMQVTQCLQDLIDRGYMERLRAVIASKLFLNRQVGLVDCGVSILPRSKTLRTDTVESKAILSAKVFYAVSAINNERIKLMMGIPGLDLTQMNDGELQTSADYSPVEHVRNAVGDPVRSDVRIVTNFSYRDAEQRARATLMSDVSLAATVLYQPQPQGYGSVNVGSAYGNVATPVQNWMPAFTITRNDSGTPVVTLEQTLLGVAMATVTMSEHLAWANVFYQNRGKPHLNLGALPVMEGGEAVDLAAATVTPEAYREFLYNFVQESPVFLYHVDRHDELGFANDPLLLAVNGDPAALSDIYNALNNLCGGNLSAILPREKFTPGLIGSTTPRLVPMGSYEPESDAFSHDRRELDVLAILGSKMANRAESAHQLYALDNDTSIDAQLRLNNRKRLEANLLGSSLVDTGYAYEVMFTPAFIEVLVGVIKAASMKVTKRYEIAQNDSRVFFNPTFRQNVIGSGLGSQLFSTGGLTGGFQGLGINVGPRSW